MNSYKMLYRAEKLPVFQNRMFHSVEAAINCAKGDVTLVQELETGLVFNQSFDADLMQYDADYQNEQAVSGVFQTHLEEVSDIVQTHFHGQKIIEVGCGKAYFLELLQSRGYDITGLDPTYEGLNPRVMKQFYCPDIGLRSDAIILRHVLEHVQNPLGFLHHIRRSNSGTGKIYIEVPCFDWICQHRAWFDIFYEHVNYFRIGDFQRIFDTVYDSGHVFGGQYLYVVADLPSLRTTVSGAGAPVDLPVDFTGTIEYYAEKLRNITASNKQSRRTVIWGGASKGVIFALYMHRAGASIDHVIDINPAKQGKYLPATGLRVSPPGEIIESLPNGSDIFIMNANYLSEIRQMTHERFVYHTVEHENI